MTLRRGAFLIAGLATAIISASVLLMLFGRSPAKASKPDTAVIVGPFNVVDQHGQRLSRADLIGRPTLMIFGATRCPGPCPATLRPARRWLESLGANEGTLRVVFVTLDPVHDTPRVLRRFLRSERDVVGLTGQVEAIERMARAYGVPLPIQPQSGVAPTLTHPAAIYLIDREGRLRTQLSYAADPPVEISELESVVREKARSGREIQP
jgi:protein SCO1/2